MAAVLDLVDKESFAARLLELRSRAGLSQMEIERRALPHFRQSHYSNWERAASTPNVTQIPTLARVLGVEIWELFEDPTEAAVATWKAEARERKRRERKREQGD